MSRRRSTAISTALALAAASLALTVGPAAADADPAPAPVADKLGAHDRALLARYERQHATARSAAAAPGFATLIVAVAEGRTAEAEAALAELGAGVKTVRTDDSVGYLKANVPFGLVEQVAALDSVAAVDLDELLEIEDTRVDGAAAAGATAARTPGAALPAAPSAATPDANPYMPTRETGSTDFKGDHPTFDGRGVTIGIMDTGVDPTHPALARTTTGENKLVESVTGTDPNNFIDLIFDSSWFLMGRQQSGPTVVTPDGQAWTGPSGSDLRVQNRLLSMPGGKQRRIGVLFRDGDGSIRVDTDGDFDFTDEEAMRQFGVDRQIGYLGTDDPATPVNERVPFTVQWKKVNATTIGVNVNVITEAHGTHVAGITAAHGLYGGAMDGQAPGAKLVSMKACHAAGCSSAALTDGMIDLATRYGVDVINMSIGSSPELNDGQSARALVYNRLIDTTGVQLFISAGNSGAGTNTVGDPTGGDKVVSVGAAVSDATWWANYGSRTKDARAMFPFSSRGPREDGGFKPDVTAPGSAVSTTPDWIAPSSVPETGYELPPGYSMLNGTSMSSPQAAGAGALLLSAAKQSGVSASPAELRAAIYSTARWNGKADAVAQGRGQFDVPKAWSVLGQGKAATSDTVTVSAPVCTPLSGQLVTPHRGSGLFNSCAPGAGGQAVGEERAYALTVTRTTGSDLPVRYEVGLKGGDDTYSVPSSVVLAKNVPTTLMVTAKPPTQGVHSAVLVLDDGNTRAVEQHTMLAVEAAVPLEIGGTPLTVTGVTYRNDTVHYTVAVPAGASTLTVSMDGLDEGSQTRWWAFKPTGVSGETSAGGTIYCYNGYLDGYGCDPKSRTYDKPAAGVWELVVESRRTSPLWANPYTLTATVS